LDPLSSGILNDFTFSFTPRSLKNGFPDSIQIFGLFFGTELRFELNKLDGLTKNISSISQILIQNNASSPIIPRESSNLVSIF
jgi:hypothetical protein